MRAPNTFERTVHRPLKCNRPGSCCLILLGLIAVVPNAMAQEITGQVIDAATGAPVAGARVHEQARPALDVVITDAQGRFSLPVTDGATNVPVAAALPYSATALVNYETQVILADEGDDMVVSLNQIPQDDNLDYQPIAGAPPEGCGSCHSEQYTQWQESNHSRAAVNVRVRDLYSGDGTGDPSGPSGDGYVFTELHNENENSGLCATCHSPNERPTDPGSVKFNEISTAPGLEGVTCTSCHQLHVVNEDVESIHLLGNAEFRFPQAFRGGEEATHEHVWGPLDDVGFGRMRAAYAPVFKSSQLCASCHEYVNPGTGAPGQETFSEWEGSPAAAAGIQCQTCHMPQVEAPGPLASVGAAPERPAEQRHDHSFPGVYAGVLGDPIDLELEVNPSTSAVAVRTRVHNRVTGHHWPTGVDVRNAVLVIEVRHNGELLTQRSGDQVPEWANDAEPGVQPGDFGGMAGRGYAKVLEGRINGEGESVSPVNFIDAEAELAKTTIPPGQTDVGLFSFDLPATAIPGDELEIRARVVYRRVWRAIAVTKGWTEQDFDEPWERVVEDQIVSRTLTEQDLDRIFFSRFES